MHRFTETVPRAEPPRPLLEKIASQVKPIMQKRGWKVGILAEVSLRFPESQISYS